MERIKIIDDVIEHVQRRKLMYLGREEVIPENLATAIANDALTLGVKEVELHHCGDWWLISSDEDWLVRENQFTIEDTFRRLVPLVGGGPEALRREVLLTAFASAVFTKKEDHLVQIAGSFEESDQRLAACLRTIPAHRRVIGFKPA